ncbi:MAG: protein-L-isoaspartate(D-aspartate) O-methyltransferase [Opitutae bacterium]|nr:protein-L-isoaspartate(D-aspartate) O-methyltransferase [Opitutae bacterium]
MVREQIEARGVRAAAVLRALRKVPRHEFVPLALRREAYADRPLPISQGQTISQPYIVALMSELAQLTAHSRVLEVGTGSGYQSAVLSEIVAEVFTIEIVPELAARARAELARLGCKNVRLRTGDGYLGWPEAAPFDAIVVTAAPAQIPPPLLAQLKVGGRLVIPVGEPAAVQELKVVTRTADGFHEENKLQVRFVPMTGRAQHPSVAVP